MSVMSNHVSADASSTIESLLELGKRNSENLKVELEKFLRDPYAFRFERKVESYYEQIESMSNPLIRGAFGFFLFAVAAEQANSSKEKSEKANKYLEREEVRDFVFENYGVPDEYRKDTLVLHRTGTTSYILHIPDKEAVLKIIKYRYLYNQTITNDTRDYKKRFNKGFFRNTARIYETGERFIIMDFIDGVTLRQHLNKLWRKPESAIGSIREVVSDLCLILGDYAREGIHHLDLSPENILIGNDVVAGKPEKIYLIDFGYNYLLGERVGSSSDLLGAQIYLAPELLQSPSELVRLSPEARLLADVYSLGMIILEMLSQHGLSSHKRDEEMDRLRANYFGLGVIIEELVEEKPDARFFDANRDSSIYERIHDRIDTELQIYAQMSLKEEKGFLAVVLVLFDAISLSTDVIRKNLEELRLRGRVGLRWSAVTQLLQSIIVLAFGTLVFEDFRKGTWFDNMPGRLVAFSLALVATKYYLNIYSTLSTNAIPTRIARRAGFWLRVGSFYFAVPILYALVIDPKAWPFCVAIGSIVPTANNYFCYRLLVESGKEVKNEFGRDTPKPVEDFVADYKSWYELFAWFGTGFLIIGLLLRYGIVKDEWVYAIVTAVLSLKMLMYNCSGPAAARVRYELERAIAAYSRALRYHDHKTLQKKTTG